MKLNICYLNENYHPATLNRRGTCNNRDMEMNKKHSVKSKTLFIYR